MPEAFPGAIITFPMLGESFSLNPSGTYTLFGHTFYWYGAIIAVGFILAMLYCARHCRRCGIKPDTLYDFLIWMIPLAIIGARLYYVIFQWSDYREHPLNAFKIWEGGLAIYGGVIAGILTGIVWCRKRKIPFGAMADVCAPGLLIGQCIGRWGNFINREAFGRETAAFSRMGLTLPGRETVYVHPTFLYESLWNVAGLLLLCLAVDKVRRFDGENTCFYFLWYGIGRFWIEGLRTDSLYLFHVTLFGERVRVSQALSLVMIVLTAVILLKNRSADPARMFVNRRLDGQATVLPDRSEERPIEDGPAEADRPAKTPAEDAAGGKASAEGAAEPADGGDNG